MEVGVRSKEEEEVVVDSGGVLLLNSGAQAVEQLDMAHSISLPPTPGAGESGWWRHSGVQIGSTSALCISASIEISPLLEW